MLSRATVTIVERLRRRRCAVGRCRRDRHRGELCGRRAHPVGRRHARAVPPGAGDRRLYSSSNPNPGVNGSRSLHGRSPTPAARQRRLQARRSTSIRWSISTRAAPALGFATTFTEGGAPVAIADSDAVITVSSSTFISAITVVLTNARPGDTLSATVSGGSDGERRQLGRRAGHTDDQRAAVRPRPMRTRCGPSRSTMRARASPPKRATLHSSSPTRTIPASRRMRPSRSARSTIPAARPTTPRPPPATAR